MAFKGIFSMSAAGAVWQQDPEINIHKRVVGTVAH